MAVKAKVLLVDDSKFFRMANEHALSRAGFEVSIAADGEEALQVVNDKLPDIILLDMMLPKISGPEVLRALKANPATMDIPVIVLTACRRGTKKNSSAKARPPTSRSPLWNSTRTPIAWWPRWRRCSAGSLTKKA